MNSIAYRYGFVKKNAEKQNAHRHKPVRVRWYDLF